MLFRTVSNSIVAGNGSSQYSGDGGPASLAGISPQALAIDSHGDLYIADHLRIRKISQGVITTVDGNGTQGLCATANSATGASMDNVVGGLTVDSSGNIYFTNTVDNEVCKITNETVASIANGATPGFRLPSGLARNQAGDLFIVAQGGVWKLTNSVLTYIAGTPLPYDMVGYSGDGGPAASAALNIGLFSGVGLDVAGNIYIADSGNNRIRILSPTGSGNPIGSFDTPLNNTNGVAGAIPVTGWALDNVGISKVQVWREPVGNEPVASNHLVYVGDAVQIAGVRPDVQALYPNLPFNDRAGWGYMLLTNFLPGVSGALGNGTYKLHFIAYNNAGGQTDLGTHTITVDNAHASKNPSAPSTRPARVTLSRATRTSTSAGHSPRIPTASQPMDTLSPSMSTERRWAIPLTISTAATSLPCSRTCATAMELSDSSLSIRPSSPTGCTTSLGRLPTTRAAAMASAAVTSQFKTPVE